jgi:hypothetical protein
LWKKLEIARRLYVRGYQPQEVLALFEFLDSLLRLPDGMEERFHAKLGEYKEEQKMKYISSIERIGIKKGIEQGIEQGIEIGQKRGSEEIVLRMLRHRFGSLDERTVSLIHQLPYVGIEQLSDVLLEFQSLEEVQSWVLHHLPPSPVNGAAGDSHELERPQ